MSTPSFNKLPNRAGLHPSSISVREERIEYRERLNVIPERETGCVKAAAPLARKHLLDEDVVGFELRTDLAGLLTTFARQIALCGAVPESEPRRITRSRSLRVPHHCNSTTVSKSLPRRLRCRSRLVPVCANQNQEDQQSSEYTSPRRSSWLLVGFECVLAEIHRRAKHGCNNRALPKHNR